MVQAQTHKVILAIGDGSNDVPMLQAADIGIGISGIPDEHIQIHGHEAASVADYAIAEFRNLPQLVLRHGVRNSTRMANMVGFFVYKSTVFYFVQLWFLAFSRWSAQPAFERFTLSLHHLLFTMLPPYALALVDPMEHVPSRDCFPSWRHRSFQSPNSRQHFNLKNLIWWLLASLNHSSIVFAIVALVMDNEDFHSLGQIMYLALLLTISGKALLTFHSLSTLGILLSGLGIGFWMLFSLIFAALGPSWYLSPLKGVLVQNLNGPSLACLLLAPAVALIPGLAIKAALQPQMNEDTRPTPVDLEKNQATLASLSQSLTRIRSSALLQDLNHGFVFSEISHKPLKDLERFVTCSRSFSRPRQKRAFSNSSY